MSTEYTQEQVQAVKVMMRKKSLYDVMGVSKDFTTSQLKKSYRKVIKTT